MSNITLIIGNQNYSTWSMRPWLFVKYHELDVDIEKVTLFTDQTRQKLANHFSNGKVPLLIDGDLEVWDTMAILEYLAEKFPHTRAWPDDVEARAVARSVSAEMHSSFTHLRNDIPMNCRRFFPDYPVSESATRDIDRIQEIWGYCRSRFGKNGPWLFGAFSIADAMFAPVVMRFRSVQVHLDTVSQAYCETVNRCPKVVQWINDGKHESEVVKEDELDWPSEMIPG
jgi:glutathione S-transferase